MNYKNYQQVLDLSGTKKISAKARPRQSGDITTPKRRTKSGCLTCRRRKKKCDEELEGGKCQACIRNFLDCCWSSEKSALATESLPLAIATEKTLVTTSPILQVKKETMPASRQGASAYPSPISSPKAGPVEETKGIQSLSLPPIKMKIEKPQKKKAIRKSNPQFIVTSFDSRSALCQIK